MQALRLMRLQRSSFRMSFRVPPKLFDTQVAGAFLGLGQQAGYGQIIEQVLGIELDKSQSLTHWFE